MNYTFKENQLDYETYYILRKSVKWNNWSREQAEIALGNSYYTVTVFDNKVPIGMGRAVGDGIYFMIMDIVVKPEYQRMGIGTAICNKLEGAVQGNVFTHASITAKPFFEKRGYKVIKRQTVKRRGVLLTNFVMEYRR